MLMLGLSIVNLPVYIGPGSTNKPGMSEKCNQAVQHTQS